MNFTDPFIIRSKEDLKSAVETLGFLPYFRNPIPGFSIEEHVDPRLWFSDEPGTGEWKGPVIRETGCAYGKFFGGKAVYISKDCFPDFANYRRDGYDFDARYDDGLASYRDKELFELLEPNAPILSRKLKELGDYNKDGKKGFDTLVTRLQKQCYILISDFVYMKDRFGKEYGWGVAEYSTPEKFFGPEFRKHVYDKEPEESLQRVIRRLKDVLPEVSEQEIRRMLR